MHLNYIGRPHQFAIKMIGQQLLKATTTTTDKNPHTPEKKARANSLPVFHPTLDDNDELVKPTLDKGSIDMFNKIKKRKMQASLIQLDCSESYDGSLIYRVERLQNDPDRMKEGVQTSEFTFGAKEITIPYAGSKMISGLAEKETASVGMML